MTLLRFLVRKAISLAAWSMPFALPAVVEAAPASVLVKSREQGQGVLFRRLDTCYLLTAGHVIGTARGASVVADTGARPLGEAALVMLFPSEDLALLRVSGGVAQECGEDFSQYRPDLTRILKQRQQGSLPFVFDVQGGGTAGGLGRLPVVVTDIGSEWIRVTPSRAAEGIEQGRSGSVLVIGDGGEDRGVGLLLAVEGGTTGKILRLDRAMALVARFFEAPQSFNRPPDSSVPQQPGQVTTPPRSEPVGNLLASAAGAKVVAFNALPSGPDFVASNLLDVRSHHPWMAGFARRPVDVDVQLAGDKVQTLSRIEVVRDTDGPRSTSPREVEIFASVDGESWRSIHRGTFFSDDNVKSVQLAPTRARLLRIRIYENWGDPRIVSVRQIRAY